MKSDKYSVKRYLKTLLFPFLFFGCATAKIQHVEKIDPVYTVNGDVYPQSLTRAEYYQHMAAGFMKENNYDRAIEYYRLSLLHNPDLVPAHLGLGDAHAATGHYLLALIAYQDAMKLAPDNTDVLKKTGDLYLSAGIYPRAREEYQAMLKLNGKDTEAQWAIFYIYKLEKKYAEALKNLVQIQQTEANAAKLAYEKALLYKTFKNSQLYRENIELAVKRDPRSKEILLEYVRFCWGEGKFNEATESLLNYSNTHAFEFEVSEALAYSSIKSGHYPIAVREFEKQKVAASDRTAVELKLAHAHFLNDDFENAEKVYLRLAIEENSDEARYYLGQIYFSREKYSDASYVLSQIPSYSEYYADATSKMALYYKSIGKDDQALNLLREAFVKRPDQNEVYRAYSDFLIEQKRFVETVALLEKGIQLFPNDEEFRIKLAYLHFRLNNQKSFKKQIKAALRINPQSAEAYSMLAELWYLKNRNVDETMYFAKLALDLKSKNRNVKPILAWALMQKDRSTEAVALFEEYYEENPNESFFARSLSQVYSRGGIKEKSKKLADVAAKLERNDSLKSRFIFKNQTDQVNVEELFENKTRLPASLENQ